MNSFIHRFKQVSSWLSWLTATLECLQTKKSHYPLKTVRELIVHWSFRPCGQM